ncbi:uncharacterized protein DS421_13g409010 [Arachis hypogaea]|nr:uncharacterized protein DS421_13g409010 [Arachis hypogaea]
MVLKTEPDRPVQPEKPGTGHLAGPETILHPQQFTTEPPPRPASGRALNPLISFQKSPRSRNHRSTVHHPVTHSHQPSSQSHTHQPTTTNRAATAATTATTTVVAELANSLVVAELASSSVVRARLLAVTRLLLGNTLFLIYLLPSDFDL